MTNEILEGVYHAFQLIISGNPMLIDIIVRSILVSGTATLLSMVWSLPIALFLSLKDFPGKEVLKSVFNTLIGIPTVALGLVLYLTLSRSGPLGAFGLLYTPLGISIGQAILVTPIVISFSVNAIESVSDEIRELAKTLGATSTQASIAVLSEARTGVLLSVISSFNRAIAELGVALMVGGNIRGLTRVLTTTIALETSRGELSLSIALAIVLLLIIGVLNFSAKALERKIK